jgi:hypothetical protein
MLIYTCTQTWLSSPAYVTEAYTLHRNRNADDEIQCLRVKIPEGVVVPTFDHRLNFLMASEKIRTWCDQRGYEFWHGLYSGCRWHGEVSDIELLACTAYETG